MAALIYYFSDIVSYIIMAWVVSMIGAPFNNFLKKYVGSSAAAGLTLLVISLFMLLMIRLFVPPLLDQAKNLAGLDYQKILVSLQEPMDDAKTWLEDKGLIAPEFNELSIEESIVRQPEVQSTVVQLDSLFREQGDSLNTGLDLVININQPSTTTTIETPSQTTDLFEGFKNNIFEMFNPARIPKLIGSFFGFFGNFFITVLSVLFIAFFFLKEHGLFTKMTTAVWPDKQEGKINHAIDESSTLLVRYFLGLILQAAVITFVTSLVLKLLGIDNALLMAFCFAVFNLIPFIGPLIGNLFGVLIVISSNLELGFYDGMLPMIIKTMIVFAVMQLVDNFLLQPNIFSRSVKAHPLEIFLVVMMGAQIGGIPGMVLAIPGYTVLRVLAKVFFSEFDVVKKLTAGI